LDDFIEHNKYVLAFILVFLNRDSKNSSFSCPSAAIPAVSTCLRTRESILNKNCPLPLTLNPLSKNQLFPHQKNPPKFPILPLHLSKPNSYYYEKNHSHNPILYNHRQRPTLCPKKKKEKQTSQSR